MLLLVDFIFLKIRLYNAYAHDWSPRHCCCGTDGICVMTSGGSPCGVIGWKGAAMLDQPDLTGIAPFNPYWVKMRRWLRCGWAFPINEFALTCDDTFCSHNASLLTILPYYQITLQLSFFKVREKEMNRGKYKKRT